MISPNICTHTSTYHKGENCLQIPGDEDQKSGLCHWNDTFDMAFHTNNISLYYMRSMVTSFGVVQSLDSWSTNKFVMSMFNTCGENISFLELCSGGKPQVNPEILKHTHVYRLWLTTGLH